MEPCYKGSQKINSVVSQGCQFVEQPVYTIYVFLYILYIPVYLPLFHKRRSQHTFHTSEMSMKTSNRFVYYVQESLSNRMTSSQCLVWGNMSTGTALTGLYGWPRIFLEVCRTRLKVTQKKLNRKLEQYRELKLHGCIKVSYQI